LCLPCSFDDLRDWPTQQRIAARVDRLALGLFGDAKSLRDGDRKLRIDLGPGYRVYYAIEGRSVVLLQCGGDKRAQRRDVARAVGYWQDYQVTLRGNEP
jgi:putative addiction module killer protein